MLLVNVFGIKGAIIALPIGLAEFRMIASYGCQYTLAQIIADRLDLGWVNLASISHEACRLSAHLDLVVRIRQFTNPNLRWVHICVRCMDQFAAIIIASDNIPSIGILMVCDLFRLGLALIRGSLAMSSQCSQDDC